MSGYDTMTQHHDKLQRTFDIVAKHLLTQMQRSASGHECLYRGPNGLKCAVGALIPDDRYQQNFEGIAVYTSPIEELLESLGYDVDLAQELQRIHDDFQPEEWRGKLKQLADAQGLSTEVLDT